MHSSNTAENNGERGGIIKDNTDTDKCQRNDLEAVRELVRQQQTHLHDDDDDNNG